MARKLPFAGDCVASFILHPFPIIMMRTRRRRIYCNKGKHDYLAKMNTGYIIKAILAPRLISQMNLIILLRSEEHVAEWRCELLEDKRSEEL